MDTTFLKNLSVDDLNILMDACQTEIGNRKTEQIHAFMDEFENWLEKVRKAGFEVLYKDDSLLTDWDIDIVEQEQKKIVYV